MAQQQQDRQRIFSHITRSRFLHVEDSLDIGKIRFFVGEYRKGQGAQATAYHFLDADDARPLMADLGWGRSVDITDYKGSANGGDGPVSRVLKIKGPKDGKFWFQVDNGPGQVIGAGAVKPAGEPTASISIALPTHDARALALAVTEYMLAYRVTAILRPQASPPAPRTVDRKTGEITSDLQDLFGTEPAATTTVGAGLAPAPIAPAPIAPAQAQEEEPEDSPPAFYNLVNKALRLGILDHDGVATRIKAPGSWRDKGIQLQAMMPA